MILTIFTPTYNRAYRLEILFKSLCEQTFKQFEWLVVDDGSTDNTSDLFNSWIQYSPFPIKYIKQANGGKHRAINRGVVEAKGELFFIVDSDDMLPETSIERIVYHYSKIKNDSTFGGVCGLKAYFNGVKVGSGKNFGILNCTSIEFRNKYNMRGDMSEVIKTSVMKEFPFPEYEGEKFCPEDILFNRIATKYKLRYFYEKVYLCEYLEDGLTASIITIRMKSPHASALCYLELFNSPVPFLKKIKCAINYWRFAYCLNNISQRPRGIGWGHMCKPLGYLYHKKDLIG